jgi:hypothetical protein
LYTSVQRKKTSEFYILNSISHFEMASGMLMAFLLVAFKIFFLAMRLFYTIRWQVLGGRWQVAGGRWQVVGGR